MEWILNLLIKILGGFLTAYALAGALLRPTNAPFGFVIGLLTIGLALLFAPKIGKKK